MFNTIFSRCIFLFLSLFTIILVACESPAKPKISAKSLQPEALREGKFTALNAPDGPDKPFIKFGFDKGGIVTGDDWDIAFRGIDILVNGGNKNPESAPQGQEPNRTGNAAAYIFSGTMEAAKTIDKSLFKQDYTLPNKTAPAISNESGEGWYNFDKSSSILSPIQDNILIFRTHNGKYAKMKILSYYKDDPHDNPGYYTFKYVYQPNEDSTSF